MLVRQRFKITVGDSDSGSFDICRTVRRSERVGYCIQSASLRASTVAPTSLSRITLVLSTFDEIVTTLLDSFYYRKPTS